MLRPYNDPEYRAAAAWLKTHPTPCHYGCGRRATTPDHRPRLAEHQHRRGTGCCTLLPACPHCNASDGAAAGNRLRNPISRQW